MQRVLKKHLIFMMKKNGDLGLFGILPGFRVICIFKSCLMSFFQFGHKTFKIISPNRSVYWMPRVEEEPIFHAEKGWCSQSFSNFAQFSSYLHFYGM